MLARLRMNECLAAGQQRHDFCSAKLSSPASYILIQNNSANEPSKITSLLPTPFLLWPGKQTLSRGMTSRLQTWNCGTAEAQLSMSQNFIIAFLFFSTKTQGG